MKIIYLIPVIIQLLFGFFIYRYFITNLTLYKCAPGWIKHLTFWATVLLVLFPILFFVFNHLGISPPTVRFSSYVMGVFFVFLMSTIIYLLGIMLTKMSGMAAIASQEAVIGLEIILLMLMSAYTIFAFHGGAKMPEVKQVEITIDNWKQENYRVVQLSDIHVGPFNNRAFVKKMVDQVNELKPDIVVITGDLIDAPMEHITKDLEPLKGISAPTFAVLGNHEFYNGVIGLKSYLVELDISLMINEGIVYNQLFNLAGISDPTGNQFGLYAPDYKEAIKNSDPTLPTILLAHQPLSTRIIDKSVDLMLSGHTHGGQIIPFNWIVRLVQPYINGSYKHLATGTQLYVNPGTGLWGPPMRLGTSSEITLFVINPAIITPAL